MHNKKERQKSKKLANLFRALGQPARLSILLTIGEGEACVCHLEAVLGYRQAYISQHLMALRQARILQSRREGRFIFYRLRDPRMLELISLAGEVAGLKDTLLDMTPPDATLPSCVCPNCTVETSVGVVESVAV